MISLDLFGTLWKDFLEGLKFYQNPDTEDSILYFITLEEVETIPSDHNFQRFAGRISFPDEHAKMMRAMFWDERIIDEYQVVRGYFPPRIEPNIYCNGYSTFFPERFNLLRE